MVHDNDLYLRLSGTAKLKADISQLEAIVAKYDFEILFR